MAKPIDLAVERVPYFDEMDSGPIYQIYVGEEWELEMPIGLHDD